MTAKQYQAMIKLETGEDISLSTARNLMSRDEEMEAIRRENGAYDTIPCQTEETQPRHSLTCYEAMERGSECVCGLFNWNDEESAYMENKDYALYHHSPYPQPISEDDVPF